MLWLHFAAADTHQSRGSESFIDLFSEDLQVILMSHKLLDGAKRRAHERSVWPHTCGAHFSGFTKTQLASQHDIVLKKMPL